jgi:hypothetical protein
MFNVPTQLPGEIHIPLAEVEELLRGIKAQEKRKGFHQLAMAVYIAAKDDSRFLRDYTKVLYPMVEEITHAPAGTVERNLRSLIKDCWARGGRQALLERTSLDFEETPTPSQLIESLTICLLHKERADRSP